MTSDSIASEYKKVLALRKEADEQAKKATEAERPWTELAWKVAREHKGLEGHGRVVFEETRFKIVCRGTGIYREEEWWEFFPIELLLSRMSESNEKK